MAETIFSENAHATTRRQFIDIRSWLSSAMVVWNEQAAVAEVRIDQILPAALDRVWTSPNGLCQIANHFVADAIDSSVRGERIEVELRFDEDSADWMTIAVRDWAGGRPDSWCIPSSIQQLAKLLEGYIDVSNHAGRSTVCSLHIPTGKLQGWLRRQSATMSTHHVSWSASSASRSSHQGLDAYVDEALQMALIEIGSFVPLGKRAFLCATAGMMDEGALRVSFSKSLDNAATVELSKKDISLQCDCLGNIREFLHRIEQTLTDPITPVIESKAVSRARLPQPTLRIDQPGLTPTPLSDRTAQPSRSARSSRERIQPRRVIPLSPFAPRT